MNGKCLLDTNIVIALFSADPDVIGNIPHAEEIFIPCIVIGELCYGANKSSRSEENLERIENFARGILFWDVMKSPLNFTVQ